MKGIGDRVRTSFLRGRVTEVIDGTQRRFWSGQVYYRVLVTYPRNAAGRVHIVNHEEVRERYEI